MTVAIQPSPSFAPFRPALALGLRSPSRPAAFGLSREPGYRVFRLCRQASGKAADGFRRSPAPPCPPDGGMTALGPRLVLPPLDQGSTARSPGGGFPRAPGSRPASSTTGSDRQLDRDRRRPLPRRDRLLVPDRDQGLNSCRVSLRRPPAAADRGAGSGIAARLAISRGCAGFYRIRAGFSVALLWMWAIIIRVAI